MIKWLVLIILLAGCGDVAVEYKPNIKVDSNKTAIYTNTYLVKNQQDLVDFVNAESAVCVDRNGTIISFSIVFTAPFNIISECKK